MQDAVHAALQRLEVLLSSLIQIVFQTQNNISSSLGYVGLQFPLWDETVLYLAPFGIAFLFHAQRNKFTS